MHASSCTLQAGICMVIYDTAVMTILYSAYIDHNASLHIHLTHTHCICDLFIAQFLKLPAHMSIPSCSLMLQCCCYTLGPV